MAQYAPFTATGDGSTTTYTIGFTYIDSSDVKARVNNILTTAFSVSGSSVTFTTAPPNGQSVKIFRDTDNQTIQADFQSGSALRAVDLNDNFTQLLFVTQESTDVSDTATNDAANAITISNNAVATSNLANTNSSNAVTTSNLSLANSTAAQTSAANANTNATLALNNSRESDGSGGFTSSIDKANNAITISNSASTVASQSLTDSATAISTANSSAVTAASAVTTANAASATAAAAQNAVAAVLVYDPIANVSSIPGSPSDGDRIEVADSTGIQSFSPLAGMPSGFTGSSQLSVRLNYTSSGSTWNWTDYSAQDPDARYYLKSSGTTNATNIATNATNIATKMPLAGGTFTGAVNFDDNVVIKGDSTNGSGKLTLNCENNSHGVNIKGPPHSAGASYTLTLPNNTGTNGQALLTNGSGALSWGTVTTDLSGVLSLTGGTMTGVLTLSGAPTASLHAATKQYVDDNKLINVDGGNFTAGTSLVTTTSIIDGGSF